MGSGGRGREQHPASPGPVFYPKLTRGGLGDGPKHSFAGEYTNNPYQDPAHIPEEMRATFSENQLRLLDEAAKTTEIPRRFQGAGMLMDYPGPGGTPSPRKLATMTTERNPNPFLYRFSSRAVSGARHSRVWRRSVLSQRSGRASGPLEE